MFLLVTGDNGQKGRVEGVAVNDGSVVEKEEEN